MFIDAPTEGEDEHPQANIQEGQAFVAARVKELAESSYTRTPIP